MRYWCIHSPVNVVLFLVFEMVSFWEIGDLSVISSIDRNSMQHGELEFRFDEVDVLHLRCT